MILILRVLLVAAAPRVSVLITQFAGVKVWELSATQVLCANQDVAMKISAQT